MAGGDITFNLVGDASGALSAINQVSSALEQVAALAGSLAIADAFIASIDAATQAAEGLAAAFIDVNSSIEQFSAGMGVVFQNAQNGFTQMSGGSQAATSAVSGASRTIANDQLSMAQAAQNHADALAQLAQEGADAAAKLASDLAQLKANYDQTSQDLATQHADTIAKIDQQEADATATFQRELANRQASFDSQMQSLEESHQRTMENLQAQLDDAVAAYQEKVQNITDSYQTALDTLNAKIASQNQAAPDTFEAQRKKAQTDVKNLKADLVEAQQSGDSDLVAALQARIQQEQAIEGESYDQYLSQLHSQQAAEQTALQDKYNKQIEAAQDAEQKTLATVQRRIQEENDAYAQRTQRLKEQYDRDVANLQASHAQQMAGIQSHLADENTLYQQRVTKLNDTYQKDVANAKAAEEAKLKAVEDRIAQEDRLYAQHMARLEQSMAMAGSGGGGLGVRAQAQAARNAPPINELGLDQQFLSQIFGRQLGGEDLAQGLNAYLMVKTMGTPFTSDQLRGMSQTLGGYGLSTTKWFQGIVDASSAMQMFGVTPQLLAGEIGRIASGQGGRAIFQLGQWGLNLRGMLPQGTFDAQGQMLHPASVVLPEVLQILQQRYQGAALRQSQTLPGILSNLQDTGILSQALIGGTITPGMIAAIQGGGGKGAVQFPGAAGQGLYSDIEKQLASIYDWISKNQSKVMELAAAIGGALDAAFKGLEPTIAQIAAKFEGWVSSGKAKADIAAFGQTLANIAQSIPKAVEGFEKLAQIGERLAPFAAAAAAIGVALLMITGVGPSLLLVAGAVAGLALAWHDNLGGVRDVAATITGALSSAFQPLANIIEGTFARVLPALGPPLANIAADFRDMWAAAQPLLVALTDIAIVVTGALINGFVQALPAIAYTFQGVVDVVTGSVRVISDLIVGLVTVVGDLLRGDWQKAWDDAKKYVGSILDDIAVIIRGVLLVVTGLFATAITFVIGIFEFLYNTLVGHSIIPELGASIVGIFTTVWDSIKRLGIEGALFVVQTFNSILSALQSFINDVISALNKFLAGIAGPANALLAAAGKPPINIGQIQPVNLGQVDTSGLTSQLNGIGNGIDYSQLANALASQPITVQLDGTTVGTAVRTAMLYSGSRNSGLGLS